MSVTIKFNHVIFGKLSCVLAEDVVLIGRTTEADIQLSSSRVSRRHVELWADQEMRVWASDLGSANGTELNGDALASDRAVELQIGDTLSLGNEILTVVDIVNHSKEQHQEVARESSEDQLGNEQLPEQQDEQGELPDDFWSDADQCGESITF